MKSITLETTKIEKLEMTEDQITSTLAYFQERVIYFTALLAKIKAQTDEKAAIASDKVLDGI